MADRTRFDRRSLEPALGGGREHVGARVAGAMDAVAEAFRRSPAAGSTLFCLGRVAGWLAHMIEQRRTNFRIRPRAKYVPAAGQERTPRRRCFAVADRVVAPRDLVLVARRVAVARCVLVLPRALVVRRVLVVPRALLVVRRVLVPRLCVPVPRARVLVVRARVPAADRVVVVVRFRAVALRSAVARDRVTVVPRPAEALVRRRPPACA